MNLERTITQFDGLAATHELYAAGATRAQLSHAVRIGRVLRVRQGWYCLPETDEKMVRAARVGGRLGCVSAARHHGLWVRSTSALHVEVPRHDARLRNERNSHARLVDDRNRSTIIHWSGDDPVAPRLAQSVIDSLLSMALCSNAEQVIAAAHSAIRLGTLDRPAWARAVTALPARRRVYLEEADGLVESITESATLFRLRRIGLRPRPQVKIPGVGFVDFLLGNALVIEVDGWEFHSDRDQFEKDRRRDALLSVRGYRVLRFSYEQVFQRWSEVRSAILAALARGDHLR